MNRLPSIIAQILLTGGGLSAVNRYRPRDASTRADHKTKRPKLQPRRCMFPLFVVPLATLPVLRAACKFSTGRDRFALIRSPWTSSWWSFAPGSHLAVARTLFAFPPVHSCFVLIYDDCACVFSVPVCAGGPDGGRTVWKGREWKRRGSARTPKAIIAHGGA